MSQSMKFTEVDVPGPKRDMIGYGRESPRVVWPDEARVAVSLVINYEEGSEVSMSAGDMRNEASAELPGKLEPQYRDLCNESAFEYGSRAGIWRLQRLLDELELKCTFFASAVALERSPEVGQWIQEAGHEAAGHGWRWEEQWRLSRAEEERHLQAAIESITATCGTRPRGWYSRHSPSVHTRELLVEDGGFVYDSDATNDDLPYYTTVKDTQQLVVPYSHTYNDGRFLLADYSDPTSFFDYCSRGLDYLWKEGATHPKMMSIGLHPRWIGQAGRAHALAEFLEQTVDRGQVWFARRIDIAEWWHEHHSEF